MVAPQPQSVTCDLIPEPAFDALCRFAEAAAGGGVCLLHLVDNKDRLRLAGGEAAGRLAFLETVPIGADAPPCGRAAWAVAPAELDEHFPASPKGWRAEAARAGIRSWLAVPIITPSGEAVGAIGLLFMEPRSLGAAERAMLESAAAMAWLLIERRRTAQKLSETEQRLLDFAESTSDWLWETDSEHFFTWHKPDRPAEPGGREDLPNGLLGRSRIEAAHGAPDDPLWAAHLADLAARRPFRDFVYRLRDADGRLRWLRVSGRPVFALNGGFLGYRGCTSDITKPLDAERAAAASEAEARRAHRLLRDAVESLQDGFAVFDSEERLVLANASFWIRRHARVDRAASTFAEMLDVAADDVLQPAEMDVAAWKAWRLDRFRNPGPPFEVRFRNGRCVRVTENRTREGGVVHVRTDVTHDKLREAKLAAAGRAERRQAHILRSIIESMGDAVFVCDRRGAFILTNPAADAIAGDATQRPYPHLLQAYELHTSDGGRRLQVAELPMARGLAGEATDDFEMLLRAPGREDAILSATGRPIRDGTGALLGPWWWRAT